MSSEVWKWLVAKTSGRQGYSDLWLPLWMHLRDTAGIMDMLCRHWLPESALSAIVLQKGKGSSYEAVDFENQEEKLHAVIQLGQFLGGVHDLGKATPSFQSVILTSVEGIRPILENFGLPVAGLKSFPDRAESPHAFAGEAVLLHYKYPEEITCIIGAHHGKPHDRKPNWAKEQLSSCFTHVNYYGIQTEEQWKALRRHFIDAAMELAGYASPDDILRPSMPAQMLLTGLLIMADWIASNTNYFPLVSIDENGSDADYPSRVENAWDKLRLPDVWSPTYFVMSSENFKDRFGFLPNAVQQAMINTVCNAHHPGILILEAQMGVGKTEAALAVADILASRNGCGGLYFGLPTQSTANGIFPRIEHWAASEADQEDALFAVRLAHNAAMLNENYQNLFNGRAVTEEDAQASDQGLMVHSWFGGRKQALLANFVIGTVDQLLLSALKQKHVMLRHLGLAGKVVIVDECHAYDAYMNQYLEMALTWLGTYGVPVIILSATLPYARRAKLMDAYVLGRQTASTICGEKAIQSPSSDAHWRTSRDYPLLTWSDGNEIFQTAIPRTSSSLSVDIQRIGDDALIGKLQFALSDGGCAGVIVNTVRRAQEMADRVKSGFPEATVILFHAGFTLEQRAEIESNLLDQVGKNSTPQDRNHLVVIGTQVLEQSLDIDFDVLVTDMCPMDLLLQRIGRLHRHQRERPGRLQQAVCLVMGADPEQMLEPGAVAVYGAYLLLRTRAFLPEHLVLPDDIPQYVQDVYDENIPTGAGKASDYHGRKNRQESNESAESEEEKAKKIYETKIKEKEKHARYFRLKSPECSRKKKNTLYSLLDTTVPVTDIKAEASVRDGDDAIEVILLKEAGDGSIRSIGKNKHVFQADCLPSDEECRRILRQKIRLPTLFSYFYLADKIIDELERRGKAKVPVWLQSNWLKGELFLFLDNAGTTCLSGYTIHYTDELGLQVKKEDADGRESI